MMRNASLHAGAPCSLRRVHLPRARRMTLRPHRGAFVRNGDAKVGGGAHCVRAI
jgi:hypothetical protein